MKNITYQILILIGFHLYVLLSIFLPLILIETSTKTFTLIYLFNLVVVYISWMILMIEFIEKEYSWNKEHWKFRKPFINILY